MKKKKLINEVEMPVLGIDMQELREGEVYNLFRWAVKLGVYCFDCSNVLDGIKELGFGIRDALKEDKVRREDIFVISKFGGNETNVDEIENKVNESLESLGIKHFDLCLLAKKDKYSDDEQMISYWKIMEKLYKEGKCRSIGVEDMSILECQKIMERTEINPMVNKVLRTPYFNKKELLEWMKKNNMVMLAHSILGYEDEILLNQEISEIAQKNKMSALEVVMVWNFMSDAAVVIKGKNVQEIENSLKSLRYKLDENDLEKIDILRQNEV